MYKKCAVRLRVFVIESLYFLTTKFTDFHAVSKVCNSETHPPLDIFDMCIVN